MSGIDAILKDAYRHALNDGHVVSPRGNPTRETILWTSPMISPRRRVLQNPVRDIRLGYAAAKVVWDLNQDWEAEPLLFWNPNGKWYIDLIDNEDWFWGESYGRRFMRPLRAGLDVLRKDPDSRRVWVPIFDSTDHVFSYESIPLGKGAWGITGEQLFPSRDFKNVPCCAGFQLRVFNGRLDMLVVMRSQSIGVMPYDVFLMSVIQELCANELGVDLGMLHWHCLSLHVYEKEIEQRERELAWWASQGTFPTTPEMDPIPHTLDEAIDRWTVFESMLRSGNVNGPIEEEILHIAPSPDPLELLLLDGMPRVPSSTVA